jgi:hypothetical protein
MLIPKDNKAATNQTTLGGRKSSGPTMSPTLKMATVMVMTSTTAAALYLYLAALLFHRSCSDTWKTRPQPQLLPEG